MGRQHLPALLLLAYLALLPTHPAGAQSRDPSPSARELRDAYPLRPSVQPPAGAATAEPAPTATPEPARRPDAGQSSQASLQLAITAALAILAFTIGFALVRPFGRRARGEPAGSADPVAATPTNGLGTPRATRPAWTAEIEWRPGDGEARFRVVARPAQGGATSVVAESAPLQWPPTSDAAVAALTAAAEQLETHLIAAGWRPLPPGDAWYARRFAWEPGARMPAARPHHVEPISTHTGSSR